MIKTIIFDVGGVYLKGSGSKFISRSKKLLKIKDLKTQNNGIIFDKRFNEGKISAKECFENIFTVSLSDQQFKQIIKFWTNTWKPTVAITNLIQRLNQKYQLVILSNSDPVNSLNYYKKGWYQYFNPVILSHEIGILKPDPRIYQITLDKLKNKPEECIFIDDQIDCLKPAQDLGINTILFKSPTQLRTDLKKFNVLI